MAGKKADIEGKKTIISNISIRKLDQGCVVDVEKKIPDKDGYDGWRRETKSYTADDALLEQVLDYVDAQVEDADIEDDVKGKGGARLVDKEKFISKPSK